MQNGEAIQSVAATRIETTADVDEYGAAVRHCVEVGESIVDYGVAHHGLGHAPAPGYVRIIPPTDTFIHWESDLSARVPGGMSFGELQSLLAKTGQYLPIDADEDMTIAEIITHNVSGPLRLTHGHCRDLLLGLRYFDATGTLITVGGRTVKNVAGYDVTRLMVGSLNTLGLIVDANLRTAAIPPRVTRMTLAHLDPTILDNLMTSLLTSDAAPWAIESQTNHDNGTNLYVTYAGSEAGCSAQVDAMRQWISSSGLQARESACDNGTLVEDEMDRKGRRAWRRSVSGHATVVVPPAHTGQTVHLLAEATESQHIDALPAHGVIQIGGDWTPDQAVRIDERITRLITPTGGLRMWRKRPEHTDRIAPFAPAQPDWPMLKKLKDTMDPRGLFNPGRFP